MKPQTQDSPAYQAFLDLVRISGILRKAGDRFFRAHGLTQVQFNVLMALKRDFPEGTSQRSLCEKLLVEAPDMTGLIRRMLARKWIRREDHPTDTRAWAIRLAPAGRSLLERIEPKYYRIIESILSDVSHEQMQSFSGLFQNLQEAVRKHAS